MTNSDTEMARRRAYPRSSSSFSPLGGAVLLLLAGCAVGPDFKKPASPDANSYAEHPPSSTVATPNVVGGDAQRFTEGRDVAGDWWTMFHSKALNDLIAEALSKNSDLKAAKAALSVARENVLAQRGAYLPSIQAGLSASHQQQPATLAPVPANNELQFSLFTPQVTVSYTPDIFGLNRRTVESLEAQQDLARYQLIATYDTLTSNVVVTAIQEASIDAQMAATREIIDDDQKMVGILQYQLDKGYASGLDLAGQESQLAQANALLPPLIKQSAQLHDLMAVLAGKFPSQAPQDHFDLASLKLPDEVPLSLPSRLVEQRPDVLQAEASLHAASAEIGIAIANRLPNLQLTANAGSTTLAIGQLFTPGTNFWTIGADLTAPIFEGGTLLHRERQARYAYDQAAAQYRSTVLTAFQNVADSLTALEQDADALRAASKADEAAKRTLDLSERQLRDGYIAPLQLLNAEQAYQQAHIGLVQAEATRYADTAALFQSLGGGWWNRPELAEKQP